MMTMREANAMSYTDMKWRKQGRERLGKHRRCEVKIFVTRGSLTRTRCEPKSRWRLFIDNPGIGYHVARTDK
jgi:hypothetical protein